MNSIQQSASGLASSLFLAVGLTQVAEKFDPLKKQAGVWIANLQCTEDSAPSTWPCNFTPQVSD